MGVVKAPKGVEQGEPGEGVCVGWGKGCKEEGGGRRSQHTKVVVGAGGVSIRTHWEPTAEVKGVVGVCVWGRKSKSVVVVWKCVCSGSVCKAYAAGCAVVAV